MFPLKYLPRLIKTSSNNQLEERTSPYGVFQFEDIPKVGEEPFKDLEDNLDSKYIHDEKNGWKRIFKDDPGLKPKTKSI